MSDGSIDTPGERAAGRRSLIFVLGGVLAVAGAGALAGALTQQSRSGLEAVEAATATVRADFSARGVQVASGIVLTSSGEVVTTLASIEGASQVHVSVPGRSTSYPASVAGLDPTDDIALLQLQGAAGLAAVTLSAPPGLTVGAHVVAVAASGAGTPTEIEGAVAALDQTAATLSPVTNAAVELTGSIGINAVLPPAAKGGPLLNSDGEVVGMDALTADDVRPRPAGSGGFATPVGVVTDAVHAMVTGSGNPRVLRGSTAVLGVDTRDSALSPGAVVASVSPVSPAQAVGIVPGDVLISIGGAPIVNATSVPDALRRHRAFDRVDVQWTTPEGTRADATVTLAPGTAT